MTKFQIFSRKGSDGWRTAGVEEAHNAEAAVRNAYMGAANKDHITDMAAVPLRSWKPTPIRTETVQKVVLGDVTPANSPEGAGVSPSEEA